MSQTLPSVLASDLAEVHLDTLDSVDSSDATLTRKRRWESELITVELPSHIEGLVAAGKQPVIIVDDEPNNAFVAGMFSAALCKDMELPLLVCNLKESPHMPIVNCRLSALNISALVNMPLEVAQRCVWVLDRHLDDIDGDTYFTGDDIANRLMERGINPKRIIICSSDDVMIEDRAKHVQVLTKPYYAADIQPYLEAALGA